MGFVYRNECINHNLFKNFLDYTAVPEKKPQPFLNVFSEVYCFVWMLCISLTAHPGRKSLNSLHFLSYVFADRKKKNIVSGREN